MSGAEERFQDAPHGLWGPLACNGRWNALEAAGQALAAGLPSDNLVLRAFGCSGAARPDSVCWQASDSRAVVLALARDSVAEWLPPGVVGSLDALKEDPSKVADQDLLRFFATDAHLLFAPVDNALLQVEVAAHRESWKIEDPYEEPETVVALLRAFGLEDRVTSGSGATDSVFTEQELALVLRLLPYLHALRGTVQGASLALSAVLDCPVAVEDRQERVIAVPEPLRSRIGVSRIGVDLVPGAVMRVANGFRIVVGPAREEQVRSLVEPSVRRKIEALATWLLPLGGAVELVSIVEPEGRRFLLGDGEASARLGLTSWTPPIGTARTTQGPA